MNAKTFLDAFMEMVQKLKKENLLSYLKHFHTKLNGMIFEFEDGSEVIMHDGSYGHEEGLWESYGMPQDDGDVTGFLTTDDVVARLKENFK